ncbi:MAG: hypothetical protein RL885_32515 [Planctomycetota bacterium]
MKLTAFALALVFAATLVLMNLPAPTQASVKDDTPLADQMLEIQGILKKIRRSVRKPEQNEESLQLANDLVKGMLASRLMPPPMLEKIPADQKDAFRAGYRKMMAETAKMVLDLEIAILDGDNDKAQELYKQIADMEEKGHAKYTEGG